MTNNNHSHKSWSLSRRQAGFSFMEVLVSLGIFMILVTLTAGVYASSISLDRQGAAHRAIQQNTTFLLEFFGKEIRNGEIDYAAYGGIAPARTSELRLLTRARSEIEVIRLDTDTSRVVIEKDGSVHDITNEDVKVNRLDFYISPAAKCTEASPICTQQIVTMVMSIESEVIESGVAQGVTSDFQTTFSIRLYDI